VTLTLPKIAADGGVPSIVDTETGELQERRLEHRAEAEKFYRDLAAQGMKVRVGMEASGHARRRALQVPTSTHERTGFLRGACRTREVIHTRTSDAHHNAALRRPLTASLPGRTILSVLDCRENPSPNRQPSWPFLPDTRCDGRFL
jgi:hypothetical protein